MEYIGYIKYQGPHIKDGLFGAREAAVALNGFDEVFRYFLAKEEPEFAKLKYDETMSFYEPSNDELVLAVKIKRVLDVKHVSFSDHAKISSLIFFPLPSRMIFSFCSRCVFHHSIVHVTGDHAIPQSPTPDLPAHANILRRNNRILCFSAPISNSAMPGG